MGKCKKHPSSKGFTLVELIVTMTILVILGTIAFISIQSYSSIARDSRRISDIGNIKTAFELFQIQGAKYPEPSGSINIVYSGATIWEQGTVGDSVITNVSKTLAQKPTDPLTSSEYSYSVLNTGLEYELGLILENDSSLTNEHIHLSSQTYASNISAFVTGNYNGKVAKVQTGSTDYILLVPSIVSGDISLLEYKDIVEQDKLVYNGYEKIPDSYLNDGGESKHDGIFDNQLENIVAFSGDFNDLQVNEEVRVQFINTFKNSYQNTPIGDSNSEIKNICDKDLDTENPSVFMRQTAINILDNNLSIEIPLSEYPEPASCELEGITINHGDYIVAYSSANLEWDSEFTCEEISSNRICDEGVLDGEESFSFVTCAKGEVSHCQETELDGYTIPFIEHAGTGAITKSIIETDGTRDYSATALCNNGSFSISGESEILTCDSNFHEELDACVTDTRACDITNGVGTQTWNGIAWSSCTFVSCDDGSHEDTENPGTCLLDTREINCGGTLPANSTSTNGTTYTQTWNGTSWDPTTEWGESQTTCDFNCDEAVSSDQLGYYWNSNTSSCEQLCMTQDDASLARMAGIYGNNSVEEICNLTTINIYDTAYTRNIDYIIPKMTNLESITVTDTNSFSINSEISNLINLKTLTIQNSSLSIFGLQYISNIINLENLTINDAGLNSLSSNIGNLVNLTSLNLRTNNLSQLPSELSYLNNLTELSLSGNNNLNNLNYYFDWTISNDKITQDNITNDGKSMTIGWNGTNVTINVCDNGEVWDGSMCKVDSYFTFDQYTGTITDYNIEGGTDVEIPDNINGFPVTIIGGSAFSNKNLTSVTIPNSVTDIGFSAFEDNQLTSIVIPNGVSVINNNSFSRNALTSITIPNSVNNIGFGAFENQMNSVGNGTVYGPVSGYIFNTYTSNMMNQFDKEKLPNYSHAPTDSSYFAFNEISGEILSYSPTGPQDVVIPSTINGVTVTSIGSNAFSFKNLTSVIIPNSVTEIKSMAFENNQLTSIIIPDGVTMIDISAFIRNALTSITIPNSVNYIGFGAFEEQIISVGNGTVYGPLSGYVYETYTDNMMNQFDKEKLPNYSQPPTDSSYFAFDEMMGLIMSYSPTGPQDVVIPSTINGTTVTRIGDSAFSNRNLTSVIIPSSVTEISSMAFEDNQLTSIIIPDGVTMIDDNAFSRNALTSITIPNSVNNIGWGAFADQMDSVGNGTVYGPASGYIFDTYTSNMMNQFDKQKLPNYSQPPTDSSYFMFDSNIGEIMMYEPDGPQDVVIPSTINGTTVTRIGSNAFSNRNLTSVIIPSSVTEINSMAFESNQLTSIIIPDGVTSIYSSAFSRNALTSITIPDSVNMIQDMAFSDQIDSVGNGTVYGPASGYIFDTYTSNMMNQFDKEKLPNYTQPPTDESYFIFDENTGIINEFMTFGGITDVVIPNTINGIPVTGIATYSFYNKNLTSVLIQNNITNIPDYAFGSNNLTEIIIPDSVTSIGAHSFKLNFLTDATLSSNLNDIGEYAFYGNRLTNIILPNGVNNIGRVAFGDNNFTSVTIPNSVSHIGQYAFFFNNGTGNGTVYGPASGYVYDTYINNSDNQFDKDKLPNYISN